MEYTFTLNNGVVLPAVGFGTYKADQGGEQVLRDALAAGYRYFDTASYYGNEELIGQVLQESGIPRSQLMLASKVWKTDMGYRQALDAFDASLRRLRTDYLDLYLIHWPRPDMTADWRQLDLDTWKALEELYDAGKVRAIGVSNFLPHHLQNLLEHCRIIPAVDQVELHPGYSQEGVRALCQAHNILVQAWSPIGRARMLGDPLLVELAARYGVSPARLCLRFALQLGVLPLPKSSAPQRMAENLDLFSFEISPQDMESILAMPQTGWSGLDPDQV